MITKKEEKLKKALIIYGTTTGNTEEMAGFIKKTLAASGIETEMKNVSETAVEDLTSDHDLVLLGCPAYGDDTAELQEDFEAFSEQLNGLKLNGKKFAVFAPGDRSYEHFCGSVDVLEERMEELGGSILLDGLKVDGDPGDAEDDIEEWIQSIVGLLK
jgi:flavodoxin short chain